jgi:hypothetical protein
LRPRPQHLDLHAAGLVFLKQAGLARERV